MKSTIFIIIVFAFGLCTFGIGLTWNYVPDTLSFQTLYNTIVFEKQPNGNFMVYDKAQTMYPKIVPLSKAFTYLEEVNKRDIVVARRIPQTCNARTLHEQIYIYNSDMVLLDSFYLTFKYKL